MRLVLRASFLEARRLALPAGVLRGVLAGPRVVTVARSRAGRVLLFLKYLELYV